QRAEPRGVAARLPVPPALPVRLGALRAGGARTVRRRARPRLPVLARTSSGAPGRRGSRARLVRRLRARCAAGRDPARRAVPSGCRRAGDRFARGGRAPRLACPAPRRTARPGGGHPAMTEPSRTLPPAKGDSDLRGRTFDDVAPPDDALLVVRGLRKEFPVR